jgi:DNA-binding transcriptional regulator YiaG
VGKVAQKILNNVRATRAAVQWSGASALTMHMPDPIDVRAIRRRLQMSQAVLPARSAVELRAVQNIKQGQRRP